MIHEPRQQEGDGSGPSHLMNKAVRLDYSDKRPADAIQAVERRADVLDKSKGASDLKARKDSVNKAARIETIQINDGELSTLATRGEEILISAGVAVYQRGGKLVRPIIETVDATRGRKTNVAHLKILDDVYLRDLLCRKARWQKYNARAKKVMPVNPPKEVAETILSRTGEWKFPAISGVISAPTMRPDGSLLAEPGYDEETHLLLVSPPEMDPIPERPTRKDAERALALLEALLTGFPFSDDVAKACALSAIITPVVRGAFPVTPMHTSRAPAAGTGKSFLWDIVAAISIGQPMPVISTGGSEQELEKRLGARMMAGQPLISIDNVTGELGGEALCQYIERPTVAVRILGRSEDVRIEARGTSLFATGNNFVMVGDVCRRAVTTNLDAGVERPELRQFDFDPVEVVLADRGKYIAAALTICRAYLVAGRPNKAPKLASFEGWSDTVRSALIWLGKPDPVQSMEAAMVEDPEREELAEMLEVWSASLGTGTNSRRRLADVLAKALSVTREKDGDELLPEFPDFHSALMAMALRSKGKAVQPDAKMLGKWLQKFKGRVINGTKFMCQPNAKRGNEWWVETV
jgi:putative DNA primase/helicase